MQDEKKLDVYQKSLSLAEDIYTVEYPKNEQFGLQSQIRRAVTSIPLLIAEGAGRHSQAEFRNFLIQARGSAKEVYTALELSKRLKFISYDSFVMLSRQSEMVGKMLTNLIKMVGGIENAKSTKRNTINHEPKTTN